jgi:Xaa-Pro dipeptidase
MTGPTAKSPESPDPTGSTESSGSPDRTDPTASTDSTASVGSSGQMTVGGRPVPARADPARMRGERHAKLQEQLAAHGLDGLLLLSTSAVAYATGADAPAADSARATFLRPVAMVVAGAQHPHLFTPYPAGAPPELPADHVHAAVVPDLDDGAALLAAAVRDLGTTAGRRPRLAVDELPHPLGRALGNDVEVVSATPVLAAAKLCKTADELAVIRQAQRVNEQAMLDIARLARPGVRPTDLTGAFLRRIVELGADGNAIDPIWQVMPRSRAEGPWTVHGDLAFPLPSSPRVLDEGDVVWVDTGITVGGYVSDFGRTWLVGDDPRPTPRQQAQFDRWRAVVTAVLARCSPGVASGELARAAIEADGGDRPWIEHFYLIHGVGTDSAEMPLVGTDLGSSFDDHQVLAPGMVLAIEPVIWDDGAAGYRAEDVVAVTDDGWMPLSDHPYDPFTDS